MKRPFIFTLCLLTAATSHLLQAQAGSDSMLSSLVGDLRPDLPAMAQKSLSWLNSLKEDYGPMAADAVEKARQTIPEKMPEALQSTVNKAYEINYAELPKEVKTWITEHPYQTTFHIANGIVFFYPSLVTGPVLWSLGWTSTGPRAGSAAAALMAKFGVFLARGAYAYLQSSAMGGYGSALVQGVTRAGFGISGASQWLNSYLHGRESSKADDTVRVERSQEGGVEVDEPAEVKAKL